MAIEKHGDSGSVRLAQISEIKVAIKNNKIVIGRQLVIHSLQNNSIVKVFISNNAPKTVKDTVGYYASLNGVPVEVFEGNSYDIGVICKKPFMVSSLAVKK